MSKLIFFAFLSVNFVLFSQRNESVMFSDQSMGRVCRLIEVKKNGAHVFQVYSDSTEKFEQYKLIEQYDLDGKLIFYKRDSRPNGVNSFNVSESFVYDREGRIILIIYSSSSSSLFLKKVSKREYNYDTGRLRWYSRKFLRWERTPREIIFKEAPTIFKYD